MVVSRTGELAEALRHGVPREMAVVIDARPREAAGAISACTPFPWMLVADAGAVPAPALAVARRHPVILAWRGRPPAEAPAHTRAFTSFASLAEFVTRALCGTVGGMRLGRGIGVDLDSGVTVRGATLEALVALHPAGFDLPLTRFHAAARALSRRGVPWRPARDDAAGGVVLAPIPLTAARA